MRYGVSLCSSASLDTPNSRMELTIGDLDRFIAYRDANSGGLARYRLPYIGEYSDRWVGEE